ncbi:hypothetical protein D3C86_1160010 [compost metagenome]
MQEVQAQRALLLHPQRKRIVIVAFATHAAEAERFAGLAQRLVHREVLEHDQRIEQSGGARLGPALYLVQRRMLVLTRGRALPLQRLQPLGQILLGLHCRHDRQGVDEQTQCLFDARQLSGPARRGRAEADWRRAGIALQQQGPSALEHGVERHAPGAREGRQRLRRLGGQNTDMLFVAAAALYQGQGVGDQAGGFHPGQQRLPILARRGLVACPQPRNVVAVRRLDRRGPGRVRLRIPAQHFAEQARRAPAVQEQVMHRPDQVMRVLPGPNQRQAGQGRRRKIERRGAIGARVPVEFSGRFRVAAPVQLRQRQSDLARHPLQRGLAVEHAGAQDVVTIDGCLPRGAKARHVQPQDIHPELVDVGCARGIVQTMEQHALLHRRQRIQILHVGRRHRQLIELLLRQAGQGEVAGCHAQRPALAMRQHVVQGLAIRLGEHLHLLGAIAARAVVQHHRQAAFVDRAIDHQVVRQWRARIAGRARRLGRWPPRRSGGKTAIEAAQVIELHRSARHDGHGSPLLGGTKPRQHAMPQAAARHRTQRFLDAPDGGAHVSRRIQQHGVDRREPSHRAR